MTTHEGLFLDFEDPNELNEDPFRCTWCRRPFDAARMKDLRAPETSIFEATARMRAEGKTLEDVLHYVQLAWEREDH